MVSTFHAMYDKHPFRGSYNLTYFILKLMKSLRVKISDTNMHVMLNVTVLLKNDIYESY